MLHMVDDTIVGIALGAIGGTALTSFLARLFISKSLKDLEHAIKKIGEIKSELGILSSRLEEISRTQQLIREIDRKVIALETRLNANGKYQYSRNRR